MHAPCVPTSKSRRWTGPPVITVITIIVYYERIEIKIAPGAHWITLIHLVAAPSRCDGYLPTLPMSTRALLTAYTTRWWGEGERSLGKRQRVSSPFFYFSRRRLSLAQRRGFSITAILIWEQCLAMLDCLAGSTLCELIYLRIRATRKALAINKW